MTDLQLLETLSEAIAARAERKLADRRCEWCDEPTPNRFCSTSCAVEAAAYDCFCRTHAAAANCPIEVNR